MAARWRTMRTFGDDASFAYVPAFLRPRVRNLLNLIPLVFSSSDAIVIHVYETYLHFGFVHWLLRRKQVLVYFYDGTYTRGRIRRRYS